MTALGLPIPITYNQLDEPGRALIIMHTYNYCISSITVPQDAHKRLALQVYLS